MTRSQTEMVPELVALYGGVEDYVEDTFGFKINVCDEAEGFTWVTRYLPFSATNL